MRKDLASAAAALDLARQNLADNPRSNKALLAVVDAEEAYLLERVLVRALARLD